MEKMKKYERGLFLYDVMHIQELVPLYANANYVVALLALFHRLPTIEV